MNTHIAPLLDELELAGRAHLDPAYVASYERKAGVDAVETLALLRRNGFGVRSSLVGLGAGTGAFGVAAARVCKRVVAVEERSTFTWLLEPMLERAGPAILEARHSDDGVYAEYVCQAR